MAMKTIEIYTDGACLGNPGPGGYGAILRYLDTVKELGGGEKLTTNNRMELTAVITALEALKEPCKVKIYSDSKYIVDSINKGWLKKWQQNNWKRGKNDPVLNQDLWQKLLSLLALHPAEFFWVKGHADCPENERCDQIAVSNAQKYK